MNGCFYCSNPATKLCDGHSCDRPLCTVHAFSAGVMIACSRKRGQSRMDSVDYCPQCVVQKYPNLPSVGDRVRCYQFTPPKPTEAQLQACIDQFRAGNHWVQPTDATWNRYEAWKGWAIVVLKRGFVADKIFLTVTSEEFPEPLRSAGVRVPATHCELVERGYGLPQMVSEFVPFVPSVPIVVPELEQTRLSFEKPRISALQEWELQNL